jgi:hypothetical protein
MHAIIVVATHCCNTSVVYLEATDFAFLHMYCKRIMKSGRKNKCGKFNCLIHQNRLNLVNSAFGKWFWVGGP